MRKIFTTLCCMALLYSSIHANRVNRDEIALSPTVHKTNIYEADIHSPSGLTIDELNHILQGTSLKNLGSSFYEMERKYSANAIFAISVACLESGIERGVRDPKNNYFGFTYGGEKIRYNSINDSIMAFGKLMQKPVFKGKNFDKFSRIYCPPKHEFWRGVVSQKYKKFAELANDNKVQDISEYVMTLKFESSWLSWGEVWKKS